MNEGFANQPQEAQTEELLLLNLFMALRKAGLRLSIEEYKLLQNALQTGFGTDRPSLKRLCQAIWVKSSEARRLYDDYFEKLVPDLDNQLSKAQTSNPITKPTTETTSESSDEKPQQTQSSLTKTTLESSTPQKTQPPPTETTSKSSTPQKTQPPPTETTLDYTYHDSTELTWPTLALESTLKIEDEVEVATSFKQKVENDKTPVEPKPFILTSEYFPVTGRQMKQSWRYLRLPIREGAPVELDLEATVKQVGYKGMLLELVLAPRRVNLAELLLLLDQDGSMVPFHLLSRQLAETLLRGGRLGKAGIYYFHNCPTEYLYLDCYRQKSKPIKNILHPLRFERSSILIFSDAGAARGGYSKQRFDFTKDFLSELKKKVRYIAWLNPMPRNYWKGTTAERIDKIVPMFEFSRRGLQDAIGVLRGCPTNLEGRRI